MPYPTPRYQRSGALLLFGAAALLAGCQSDRPAGHSLPTVSSKSVALPGAVNAADAPNSPAVAESSAATLVRYTDQAHGVSFEYPSVWRPSDAASAVPAPAFSSVAPKPLITQAFLAAQTYYADTVLSSLSFSYTVQPRSSSSACAALPGKALQVSNSRDVSYNGVVYTEADGGDAAMCHQQRAFVDSTLRGSTCYVFERDIDTTCPYVKTDKLPRPLTPQEQVALSRHLNAVMQSVQFTGKTS